MAIQIPEKANEFTPFEEGGVRLPFDAPLFWWVNGSNRGVKNGSGVDYFGGWSTDGALLDSMVQSSGIAIPDRLVSEIQIPKNGNQFTIYSTRWLAVAPIARRFRWLIDQDKPNDKGRGHSQVLCLCSFGKPLQYWMPVILSAKGLASKAIDTAFKSFETETAVARKTWAHNAAYWFFWTRIGTFSDERNEVLVGPRGTQSPIVEAQTYVPADLTEAKLDSLYVGERNVDIMLEMKELSSEWANAWIDNATSKQTIGRDVLPENEKIPF